MHNPLGTIQYFSYGNKTIEPVFDNYGNDTDYVLHHGLRNPWKFDTDNQGRLWIADVGQYCFEEVNVVPMLTQSNFGWSGMRECTFTTLVTIALAHLMH